MVVRLNEGQIAYLRDFVEELKETLPYKSIDDDQTLEYTIRGLAWYSLQTEEGIYILIGAPGRSAVIAVEYTSTSGLEDGELEQIAGDHGLQAYHSIEEGAVSTGTGIVGLRAVEIFPQKGPPLSLTRFIEDYLFKVSKAAEAVRERQRRLGQTSGQ